MVEKLKPCPFCGASGKTEFLEYDGCRVHCLFCQAKGPAANLYPDDIAEPARSRFIEDMAVKKWNRRTDA